MGYRIDLEGGKHSLMVADRPELIETLKTLKQDGVSVEDVRKTYRTGVSSSILESYQKYL